MLRVIIMHCWPTYLDKIIWISFFTQGASGSRQTCLPLDFSVALKNQTRNRGPVRTGRKGIRWHWRALSTLKETLDRMKRGLTWSRCLRSASWQESAPPAECGGRWVCSLSWCSGSAAPLPGFLDSSLLENRKSDIVTKCLYSRTIYCAKYR